MNDRKQKSDSEDWAAVKDRLVDWLSNATDNKEDDDSPFSEIQHHRKRAFLTAYAHTGKKGLAAKLAGIDRSAIYQPGWRDDPEFQEGMKVAEEILVALLEDEVFRRAVIGVQKPVGWYRGQAGGYVRQYSDVLLMFMLKALRPEKYRDRIEHRNLLAKIDLTQLPDPLLERIAKGEHPLAVLASAQPDHPALLSSDKNSG